MNPNAGGSRIELFHAGGKEAEVEEVFRRIFASGTALDQVEIACASPGYDTLIWEKALRLEWPATLGTGLPIECTRPGRALLGFCEWIESDFVGEQPPKAPRVRRHPVPRHRRPDAGAGGPPAREVRGGMGTCDLRAVAGQTQAILRARVDQPGPDRRDPRGLRGQRPRELAACWTGSRLSSSPSPRQATTGT